MIKDFHMCIYKAGDPEQRTARRPKFPRVDPLYIYHRFIHNKGLAILYIQILVEDKGLAGVYIQSGILSAHGWGGRDTLSSVYATIHS